MTGNERVRLLALGRRLEAWVCPMCAALVVVYGREQHEALHRAQHRDRDDHGPHSEP